MDIDAMTQWLNQDAEDDDAMAEGMRELFRNAPRVPEEEESAPPNGKEEDYEMSVEDAQWENLRACQVHRIPANWPINNVICMNIEKQALETNATQWGAFNLIREDRADQKKLLFLMARAVSSVVEIRNPSESLNPMTSNGYFRCADNQNRSICIPRVSVFLEALVDENGRSSGWRFFFVQHDPTFDIPKSMYRIVANNGRRSEDATNRSSSRKRGRNGARVSVQKANCYRSISQKDLYISACRRYLGTTQENNNPFTSEALRTANPCFYMENHPFSPTKIFGLERTMTVRTQYVCDAQKNLVSYRPEDGGLTFPKPPLVWNIPLFSCIPERLHKLPIPRVPSPAPVGVVAPTVPPVADDDDEMDPGDDSSRHAIQDRLELAESDELPTPEPTEEDLDRMGRHYWQGSQSSGAFLDVQTGKPVSSFEQGIIDRSFLLQLRKKNEPEKDRIRSKYYRAKDLPATDPQRSQLMAEYQKEMSAWKEASIKEWWDNMEYCDSDAGKISSVVKSGISFFRHIHPQYLYPERNMTARNLSTYGNMRLWTHESMKRVYRFPNGRVARRFYQLLLARTSALTFSYGLHINILADGKSGLGKSYVLESLVKECFPDSCDVATRVTKNAFNTGQDYNDRCLIIHEAPPHVIGIDERGNITIGDENIKDRLTSNVSKTYMCQLIKDPETGEVTRNRILSFARCMGNMIVSTNARPPPSDHPLMQRFLRDIVMKDYGDSKFEVADIALALEGEEDVEMNMLVTRENQVLHVYEMLVEKAIEAGVLDDINGNIAIIHFRQIFNRLHKEHGMPKVSVRLRDQMYKLARIAAIKHAIHITYCTEISAWRETGEGATRPFDPLSLLEVERYLVITEEIVGDILALFEDTFVPIRCQDFMLACKTLIGDPQNPPWRLVKSGDDTEEDMNYVQFSYGSVSSFCEHISDRSGQKLSADHVDRILRQLRKDFLEIKDQNEGPNKGNRKRIAVALIEEEPEKGKRARRVSIAKQRLDHAFHDDALKESIQYALCYTGCKPRRIITSLCHKQVMNLGKPGKSITRRFSDILGCIDVVDPNETPGMTGRILTFKNHMSFTTMDYATSYNRVRTGPKRTKLSMESPSISIIGDLEKITFAAHWCYIGGKYNPYSFPWEIEKLIWLHRTQNRNVYGGLIHLEDYPGDAVDSELHRARKLTETMALIRQLEDDDFMDEESARKALLDSCYARFSGAYTGKKEVPISNYTNHFSMDFSGRRPEKVTLKTSKFVSK